MRTANLLPIAVWLAATTFAAAQDIEIRISIKVIVNPTNGVSPSGISNGLFYAAADRANQWMADYWRGYRFRVSEIVSIGGPAQGGLNGPSKWFGRDPRDRDPIDYWVQFQSDTKTDNRYLLRSDQVNFYISTGSATNAGGACPIPPGEATDTACWGQVNDGPFWIVHETGHFFGLSHTHGGCGCPDTDGCFLMNGFWVGDDGITDTLAEASGDFCFTTKDLIARANFNKLYANCTPVEAGLVDDTFFNAMSYHNPTTKDTIEDRMTELQLDRHADTANSSRSSFVSGRTRFVSTTGSVSGTGTSTNPLRTVSQGVGAAAAGGGDAVLFRPGSYNEQLTINKPITLRATRTGPVTIGK